MLMPMMLGMLVTSIISGRLISRFGRYKLFPIIGTATMTFGLGALSLLSIESSPWHTAIDALWLGLGMGMVMQVLIIAVQNSVDYKHLGVATSGTMLFRSLGGALGVAMFGAIFANGLHAQLAGPGMEFLSTVLPSAVRGLPPSLHQEYITAVMAALRPVFLAAAIVSAFGFALAWLLHESPLREGAAPEGMGESFAMPRDATSLEELERIVTVLVAHENRWRVYADLARRVGVDLPPPELWMLARLGEREPMTLASLSAELEDSGTATQASIGCVVRSRHRREAHRRTAAAYAGRDRAARPRGRRAPPGSRRHVGALEARAASRRAGPDRAHGAGAHRRPAGAQGGVRNIDCKAAVMPSPIRAVGGHSRARRSLDRPRSADEKQSHPGGDGCRLLRGFDVHLLVRRHAQAGEIGQAEMQELGVLLRGEGDGLASVDIDRGERAQRLTVDRA